MYCKICGMNETDNPDKIGDDCKLFLLLSDVIKI